MCSKSIEEFWFWSLNNLEFSCNLEFQKNHSKCTFLIFISLLRTLILIQIWQDEIINWKTMKEYSVSQAQLVHAVYKLFYVIFIENTPYVKCNASYHKVTYNYVKFLSTNLAFYEFHFIPVNNCANIKVLFAQKCSCMAWTIIWKRSNEP